MGCFPDKPKRIRTISHRQDNIGEPIRKSSEHYHHNENKEADKPNEGLELIVQPMPSTTPGQLSEQTNRQLAQRYSIAVRDTTYKTPNIHTYNYQPLIHFNPSNTSNDTTEQQAIDKTYGGLKIPTLTDIQKRLLFSKH